MDRAKPTTESGTRLVFLLGLAIVLAGLALWDWQTGEEKAGAPSGPVRRMGAGAATEPVPVPSGKSEHHGEHPLANLDLDALHDTIARPLFEKRRRPPDPPATHAPMAQAPAPPPRRLPDASALTLLGVLVSEGRTIALLKRNPSGQNVRVEEGDTIDGWTIERIESQRVVLKQGDAQIALRLFRKR